MRVLIPDSRGLERNFHDVTIVDMGDLPEVSVSLDDFFFLSSPPSMVDDGTPSYCMVAAGPGFNACGGQKAV